MSLPFNEPQLARAAERLSAAELDALPYGAIRLDPAGKVVFYSEAEGRLAGYSKLPVVGRDFFTDIAPCLASEAFKGRIERARLAGSVDIEFSYVGDFDDPDKDVCFRIQSASDGGIWIFTQRL